MPDRVHPARDHKLLDWLKDNDTGDARTQDFAVSFNVKFLSLNVLAKCV